MSTQIFSRSPEEVGNAIEDLKIKSESSDDEPDTITLEDFKNPTTPTEINPALSEEPMSRKRIPETTRSNKSRTPKTSATPQLSQTPKTPKPDPTEEHEEVLGGDITVKMEPGKPPKLSRSSTHKIMAKPVALFDHLPDKTSEACEVFEVIQDSIYANKNIGGVDDDGFECECDEDWGK